MTYNEKTIYIKQKEDNNKERIFNIVTKSLEKYNNCLKFKELGEIKNGDKTNNPSKLIGTKNNDVLKVSMVENYIYSTKNKNKNIGETKIYYKINEIDNEVRLFGDDFVENNKAKCYIVNNGKKYPLKNYFSGNSKSKNIVIHLIEINKITKLQRMFEGCSSLESLPDISKWNTNNVTNMSYLFYNCSSLESLPDISKWNTYNVENMSYLFYNCSSLKSLPDISKWKMYNIYSIEGIFEECCDLTNIPDISNWFKNDQKMNNKLLLIIKKIFYNCALLSICPIFQCGNWILSVI